MPLLDPAFLAAREIVKHLAQMSLYLAEQQFLAVLRREHDKVLALPVRVIKMIELCFHHGLLEGSWRFPKETSCLYSRSCRTSCFRPAIGGGLAGLVSRDSNAPRAQCREQSEAGHVAAQGGPEIGDCPITTLYVGERSRRRD